MSNGIRDRLRRAPARIALTAQRLVVRSAGSPLRPLWRLGYRAVIGAASTYLRAGRSETSVYLRGSLAAGDALYGSADIDLALVVPGSPGAPGAARAEAYRHWRRVADRVPPLAKLVHLKVYEGEELRRAAAVTTHTETPKDRLSGDEAGLRLRPGLEPAASGWRRIAGPERRPTPGSAGVPPHLAAWLELQWWWRLAFDACLAPERRHVPYLCLKLVTQSARVRIWLEHGELLSGHREVLARARELVSGEEEVLRMAERLWKELPRSPEPPLAEALGFLLRTTQGVAEHLKAEARDSGATGVELLGAETAHADLLLDPGARAKLERVERELDLLRAIPLADWRARTPQPLLQNGRIGAPIADEALALLNGDPSSPVELAALSRTSESGLRPALRAGPVLVLPSASYFDWLHRSVQLQPSDPVSFALAAGERVAQFSGLAGWSAAAAARRARDAHAFALREYPAVDQPDTGAALGLLFGAARAALFAESIERNQPALAVTAKATAVRLTAAAPALAATIDEAYDSYRGWRTGGQAPEKPTITAFRALIESLPAYAVGNEPLPTDRAG